MILRRYRQRLGDEREFAAGAYHVRLERGPLRSIVTVWKDVRPAVGGLIARRVASDAEAERIYDDAVAEVASHG